MAIKHSKPIPALTSAQLERFNRSFVVGSQNECWEWIQPLTPKGYGNFQIYIGKIDGKPRYRQLLAHRVSYFLHKGVDPVGSLVLHGCDNPRCVCPSHLSLGNFADNSADMVRRGRNNSGFAIYARKFPGIFSGENNKNSKLTWEKVGEIREMSIAGFNNPQIAARFGVSVDTIWKIVSGRYWKPRS